MCHAGFVARSSSCFDGFPWQAKKTAFKAARLKLKLVAGNPDLTASQLKVALGGNKKGMGRVAKSNANRFEENVLVVEALIEVFRGVPPSISTSTVSERPTKEGCVSKNYFSYVLILLLRSSNRCESPLRRGPEKENINW